MDQDLVNLFDSPLKLNKGDLLKFNGATLGVEYNDTEINENALLNTDWKQNVIESKIVFIDERLGKVIQEKWVVMYVKLKSGNEYNFEYHWCDDSWNEGITYSISNA